MRSLTLTLLIVFFSLAAYTQSLTGRITDEKGEPLPGATVFLTRTQYMSATDAEGRFTLKDVPPGNYELAVKMLGFVPLIQKVAIGAQSVTLSLKLKEESKTLSEVTITEKAKADPNREKYLKWFTQYFIGESTNAGQCSILNPEVLHFTYDEQREELTARTDKLLQIANAGLGYKVNYLITEFKLNRKALTFSYSGYPYFEALKGREAQQKRWEQNRRAAYASSIQHFIRSAYKGRAEQEGFVVYPSTDIAAREGIKVGAVPAASLFEGNKIKQLKKEYNNRNQNDTAALFVYYKDGAEPYSFVKSGLYVQAPFKGAGKGQLSKLEPVIDDIRIDSLGRISPEQGFLVSGYWAWTKVAELLPEDYGLQQEKANPVLTPGSLPVPDALARQMDATVASTEAYYKSHPKEKIYVQLNKPWYGRADTLWFKAYTVDQEHKLTDKSITAYAELIAPDDSVVQRISLQLASGMANGEFTLPEGGKAGNYRIRAWTNWMKNEGEDNYYERAVNIGGLSPTAATGTTTPAAATTTADLQFFPEGGTLVNGVTGKVAFKALNNDGTAANITGTVTDSKGNTITTFTSGYEGSGTFSITPQAGQTYMAKVTFASGKTANVNLPEASASGMSLAVENDEKSEEIKITVSADNGQEKAQAGFYVLASANGKIVYQKAGIFNQSAWQSEISEKQLPSGITRITLFSARGEPMAERIVFIKNSDNLALGIAKAGDSNNEQTGLMLIAKTERDEAPVTGSFSASVVNEDIAPADEQAEPTIISTLLLSDELRGNIRNPNHYLTNDKDMDLLLLTQGYRKFDWKKINDQTSPKYKAEDGLTISGRVLNAGNNKPAAGAKVTIAFAAAHIAADTTTDGEGNFSFPDLEIHGKMLATLKAITAAGSDKVKIAPDQPESKVPAAKQVIVTMSPAIKRVMQQRYADDAALEKQAHTLKTVTIKEKYDPDKKLAEELSTSANLNGPGHADQVIMGDKLEGCGLLGECLIGKIAFAKIYPNGVVVNIARGGSPSAQIPTPVLDANGEPLYDPKTGKIIMAPNQPIPMTVMIDGAVAPVTAVNPQDIYSIEILTSAKYKAIYGHDAVGGLMLITTKRGIARFDAVPREKAPGLISFTYDGYYKARTFYQPKYRQGDAYQPGAIYWNPEILTDKDGKAGISFNNAGKGHYRVVVEGIDGEGRLGHAAYSYEVK